MGRNAQGIGTSPFSVWVENCSELKIADKAEKKKLNKLIDKIYDNLDRGTSFANHLTINQLTLIPYWPL